MSKTYFVSYNFSNKDGLCGFGNVYFSLDNKLTGKTIRGIEEYITKKNGYKDVVILNIMEIEEDEYKS